MRQATLLLAFTLLLLAAPAACEQLETAESPTTTPTLPSTASTAVSRRTATLQPPTNNQPVTPTSAPTTQSPTNQTASNYPSGALIDVAMHSRVGVLLDEIPESERARITGELVARPDDNWQALAARQVQLTLRRLNFRNFVYPGKGQLPLPPRDQWQIELGGAPRRETVDGHDLVLVDYTFTGTLLTDVASPGEAEPTLAEPGGAWEEPFVLPLDPNLLLQRTGNACANESGFPPDSYDSENIEIYYDFECTPDSVGPGGCHRAARPQLSCREALAARVGMVETAVRFERLAWDEQLAEQVRTGPVLQSDQPDLTVVGEDLHDHRIVYRYVAPDSCALVEQCVGGSGWRRLLMFDATVHNQSGAALHIGRAASEDPIHNLFTYNACHDHFHFVNYGEFRLGAFAQPSKQAFCVESTNRFSNNEFAPLTHPYTCTFQGIQAGWVDEYGSGLDCQWIDITGYEQETADLTFAFNTDQFLCEGEPETDEEGNTLWEESATTTVDGRSIDRPACEFVPDWNAGNSATVSVAIPESGGFVTEPCVNGELGPLRNCGFQAHEESVSCTPGQPVTLTCSLPGATPPQTVRVCESSAALETGIPCEYGQSLANRTITEATAVNFTCPLPRSEGEPGGGYALYTAPVFNSDRATPVTCTVSDPERP